MSDVGYQSNSRKISMSTITVSINMLSQREITTCPMISLKKLVNLIMMGILNKYPREPLQIENELYDVIRPKRRGESGERPVKSPKKAWY